MRVWLLTGLAVALLAAAAAGAAALAWPAGAVAASESGLAGISLPGFAGQVTSVSVVGPGGKPIAVSLRDGTIWPSVRLAPGEHLAVTATIRRPGWIGWLVGNQVRRTVSVVTPVPTLRSTLLRPARGAAVGVRFASPVSRVSIGGGKAQTFSEGRSALSLGVVAAGRTSAGATTVAAAARPWEKLSQPLRVSWFVAGVRGQLVTDPAPARLVSPRSSLTLTFSRPVASVLGSSEPRLVPRTPGTWKQLDSHTVSFQPAGFGLPLAGIVHVVLPHAVLAGGRLTRRLTWHVAGGSTLRLQEILARLGYLPVRWHSTKPSAGTIAGEVAAAVRAPQGRFSWRYRNTPASLQVLWKPGSWNVVTQGALMAFELRNGLATDGDPGPLVWRALLRDDLAGRRSTAGYTYVFVHETIPQSMNLWHDGTVIQTSPGNTGIASAPTAQGTWPVFEHLSSGTMSGTNPDGTHYNDPGVRWISYFHGGDALHAFPRASYGTPQSLGCVELPYAAAAAEWPYTTVGTLVTIEQ